MKYIAVFEPSFVGLHAESQVTAALAKEFKAYLSADKADPSGRYAVDYIDAAYVFDPAGRPRLPITLGTGAMATAVEAAALLKERA